VPVPVPGKRENASIGIDSDALANWSEGGLGRAATLPMISLGKNQKV